MRAISSIYSLGVFITQFQSFLDVISSDRVKEEEEEEEVFLKQNWLLKGQISEKVSVEH